MKKDKIKICKRCVAPVTALNTVIGNDGICNLCCTFDRLKHRLTDYPHMKSLFEKRIAEIRGKHEFDAMVGLSGGKDSSYVAWRLVHDHGLNLLLFTYDNGYLTASARRNIEHMVEELGQKHIFIGPGQELQTVIARSSMQRFGVPCIGCTLPGFLAAIKTAFERKIPYIIHGRSPAQMFKELAPGSVDPFLPFLKSNFLPRNKEQAEAFIKEMSLKLYKRLKWIIEPELKKHPELVSEFENLYFSQFANIKGKYEPVEFLGYYLFEPYDENLIKSELEKKLGWHRPVDDRFMGHDDCVVHAASVFLYTKNYGHPILQPELATLVRMGQISRSQALDRLKCEIESTFCDESSMNSLGKIAGLSSGEIAACARRSHRRLVLFRNLLNWRNSFFKSFFKDPL